MSDSLTAGIVRGLRRRGWTVGARRLLFDLLVALALLGPAARAQSVDGTPLSQRVRLKPDPTTEKELSQKVRLKPDPTSEATATARGEIWARFGPMFGGADGSFDSDYEPRLAAGESTGRATQQLTIDQESGFSLEFGTNLFPARHVGVQALVAYERTNLGGESGLYELELHYVSRPPPSNLPVPVDLTRTTPGANNTEGRLEHWTIAAGPVVRAGTERVGATVSGGIAWQRLSGTLEPVSFTTFQLGGHSVLFSNDYALRLAFGPEMVTSAYLAGALDVVLSRTLALSVGLRRSIAGEAELPARVDAVLNQAGAGESPPLGDIDRQLAPGPVRLAPSAWVVTVGLKAMVF